MSYLKVILEGHCFFGMIEDQSGAMGFYTTVGIVAVTRQDFAHELEEALDFAIKKNGLHTSSRPLQKSFCRISEVYSVDSSNAFSDVGGMTFFHESSLEVAVANLTRIFLTAFKSRDLVKIRQ